MSLSLEQIEHVSFAKRPKSKIRKWMKNQRDRKIRRVPSDQKPNIKYNGWEF